MHCGCRFVKAGNSWWQVVACPLHQLELKPLHADPEASAERCTYCGFGVLPITDILPITDGILCKSGSSCPFTGKALRFVARPDQVPLPCEESG